MKHLHLIRRYWWHVLLVLIGLLVAIEMGNHESGQAKHQVTASPQPPSAPKGTQAGGADIGATGEPPSPTAATDIFAVRTWEPPPPPMDMTPPAPEAPPVPFRFLGRIAEHGQKPAFLLGAAERVMAVRVGDTIDKEWRLENAQGGELIFRYRPLNLRQTLPISQGGPS